MRQRRASSTARGYDYAHQQERARWQPTVDAGQAHCHAIRCLHPSRWIPPRTPWHLGHTPDRTAWTGPEHARCNTSEGATRGNQQRGAQRRTGTRSTQRGTQATTRLASRDW